MDTGVMMASVEGPIEATEPRHDLDRMPIGVQGNVINQPAGDSYVRVNITGILQTDVLQHTEIFGSTQGYWTVTRDGNVVAVIADPELEGFACRGSAVGGA